jgi:hypothetical protein
MPPAVAVPKVLIDPGFLWLAPLGTAEPTNTVTAGVFSDAIPVAWLPLGATTEGSEFRNASTIEAVRVAELFDPVMQVTTERETSMAFALAHWSLSNYRRALNGGVAALTPTGASGAELTTLEPPDPGSEVRAMLLWESTDSTVRILLRQCLQGGEITSAFKKAPENSSIPCTFNAEAPASGAKPWVMWGAGTTRV